MSGDATYEVFVCHASEDRLRFVEPLLRELAARGVKVWYDRVEIKPDDNIAARINDGLARSRFGVVVLSPRFWKYWTGEELGALYALEALDPEHRLRIIPVCFEVDHVDIAKKAPLLVRRLGIPAGLGVDEVARRIAESVRPTAGVLAPLAPGLGRARIYNLPERPRAQAFVGRDQDMATLEGLLTPGADGGAAAAVEGMFGFGKTEVALQLAHRLAMTDRFPGGIFWLDGSQTDLTPQWGGRIADEKRIGQGPQAERAQAVLGEIASTGAALVILDNVEAWSSADAPKPLPHGAQIALLVTTRARDLGGSSFKHVTLGVLSAKDSRELLLFLAGAARDGEVGLDGLLGYLDGLALAIELAGAYLRKFPTVTVAEYLAQLRAGAPVEEKVVDKVRYEATVRAAFDATCAKLDAASRRALRVCGCFADADASIALLRACGVELDAETALRDLHLIVGGATRWSMHRLVRSNARVAAGSMPDDAFFRGCQTHASTIDLMNGFRIYREERAHFARAVDVVKEQRVADPAAMVVLAWKLGIGAHSSSELPDAEGLLEWAIRIHSESLPDAVPVELRYDLAMVHRDQGKDGAATAGLGALTAELDPDEPHLRRVKNSLALLYFESSKWDEARVLVEPGLAEPRDLCEEEATGRGSSRAILGMILHRLGELELAEKYLKQAVDSAAASQDSRLLTVSRESDLAEVLRSRGDLVRAEQLLRGAHEVMQDQRGDQHSATAKTLARLARVLLMAGRPDEARPAIETALRNARFQPPGARHRSDVAEIAREMGIAVGEGDGA